MSALSERIKVVEPSVYSDSETAIEAKLVLLGDSGTGKSSLVQRYVHESFDNTITTTVGAGFANKRIVMNDIKIKLQIWDTAGQERFRSMAPMYYRGAAAAILVYDITNQSSFHAVKGWIKELNDAALHDGDLRRVAIGIAGNKKDLEDQRAVSTKDGLAYAKSIGAFFLETSAKANEGLEELFVGVCQRIMEGNKGKRSDHADDDNSASSPKRDRTPSKAGQQKPQRKDRETIKLEPPRPQESRQSHEKKRRMCVL